MEVRPIDGNILRKWCEKIIDQACHPATVQIGEVFLDKVRSMPTLTPPNEPLTREQLREMDGEPVYVVPANEYSELGKWCVISIGDSDDYSCALVPGVEYWSWKFEGYGEQWLAYRRPPEG